MCTWSVQTQNASEWGQKRDLRDLERGEHGWRCQKDKPHHNHRPQQGSSSTHITSQGVRDSPPPPNTQHTPPVLRHLYLLSHSTSEVSSHTRQRHAVGNSELSECVKVRLNICLSLCDSRDRFQHSRLQGKQGFKKMDG